MIGLWIKSIIYTIVGIVMFTLFVESIRFPKLETTNTQAIKVEIINKTLKDIEKDRKKNVINYIQEKYEGKKHIIKKEKDKISSFSLKSLMLYKYIFENNSTVISVLYIVIMISFLLQVLMFVWSTYYEKLLIYINEKKLDSIFLYSSEWAVNIPPVLGVVGTIFSFGIVVSNMQDVSSLSTLFKDNFANAALTTIIGGCVYVINLLLNIFIAKNLVRNEQGV